jgi:hypothetical protein
LTDAVAGYYTEAARVCLDRHHRSPVAIAIDNSGVGRTTIAQPWRSMSTMCLIAVQVP